MKLFVFDVESIGLHGEGFAVGWVVVDSETEAEKAAGYISSYYGEASGTGDDRKWVEENVLPFLPQTKRTYSLPDLRLGFWYAWQEWAKQDAIMFADCGWPVEARFLARCVDDSRVERNWQGPYPLHEAATVFLLAGMDPLADYPREENELPKHDPLCDARQTARLLVKAMKQIQQRSVPAIHEIATDRV